MPTSRLRWICVLSSITAVMLAAVLLIADAADAQAEPVQKDVPGEVTKLQQERIAILRELVDGAKRSLELGRVRADRANARLERYQQMLFEAELEAAKIPQQRIDVLSAWIGELKRREENTDQLHKRQRASKNDVLEIKAYRLQMETELARESAKR